MNLRQILKQPLAYLVAALMLFLVLWPLCGWNLALRIAAIFATSAIGMVEYFKNMSNPKRRREALCYILTLAFLFSVAVGLTVYDNYQSSLRGKQLAALKPFIPQILQDQLKAFDLGVQTFVIQFQLDKGLPDEQAEQKLIDLALTLGISLLSFEAVLQEVRSEYESQEPRIMIWQNPLPEAVDRYREQVRPGSIAKKLQGIKPDQVVNLYWIGFFAMSSLHQDHNAKIKLREYARKAAIPLDVVDRFEETLTRATAEEALIELRKQIETVLQGSIQAMYPPHPFSHLSHPRFVLKIPVVEHS